MEDYELGTARGVHVIDGAFKHEGVHKDTLPPLLLRAAFFALVFRDIPPFVYLHLSESLPH